MAITGQVRRRRVVINADAYISGATSNVPVLVKFDSTSHPDLFATGDDKGSVWFSTDAGGQTTLYHEGVVFDSTDAIFYVKVDLSSTADTVIYFWYGTPAITGTESKTNVWVNGIAIYHFEGNSTDTLGSYSGTDDTISYSSSSGVTGQYATFNGSSSWISTPTMTFTTSTVLAWYSADVENYSEIMLGKGGDDCQYIFDFYNDNYIYNRAGLNPVWGYKNAYTYTTKDGWNMWTHRRTTNTAQSIWQNISDKTSTQTGASNVSFSINQIGRYSSTADSGILWLDGKLDNLWIFSVSQTDDWVKAVYNNVQNYSTFITIDGAVGLSGFLNQNILTLTPTTSFKTSSKITNENILSLTPTTSFYTETQPLYWDLNIIKGDTTYNLKDLNIIQTFDFNASYNRKSHTVTISLLNDGDYYNVFHKGNEIELYIYNDENNKTEIFNGMITSVKYNLSNYDESYILIRGEDKGSIRLKQKLITGNREFQNKTVPEIVTDIIETYTPDITTTQVYSDTEELPYKSFTWITVADALDELAKLVNGYYYVDVNNDLVFKLYEDTKPKHEISKSRLITAQFGEDYEDTFDRVYVLGGKENILENDFADEDVVTNINCIDYYYAVKVTTSAVNINKISVVCAKVGLPRYNLGFSIIADKNGEPLGQVMGTGFIDTWDIGETPDWVDSSSLNIPLITDTFWIVFNLYTNGDEYFVLYHDNATADGHYRSEDIETWVTQTGALAVKTYYGIQIVSTRTGTKQLNDYYSELLVTDESIETIEMGERTAEQKLVEKIGQNSSSLTVIPNIRPIMPAEKIRLNIGDVLNDEQVVTNVTYSIDDNKVLFIELECIKAIDFYTAFADLYNAIKKINIKNTTSRGGKNIEYIGQQETFDEPIEDINIYERDATSDEEALGDDDFIFGVFKW